MMMRLLIHINQSTDDCPIDTDHSIQRVVRSTFSPNYVGHTLVEGAVRTGYYMHTLVSEQIIERTHNKPPTLSVVPFDDQSVFPP